MACTAGEEFGCQGRRTARAAPRGRGAATPGDPAAGQLGRPGGAGRAGAAAAPAGLVWVVRGAGHAAALASRPGPTPLDLPPSAWPSGFGGRAPRVGAAAGQGEPDLGLPEGPQRAVPTRLQGRGQHRVDDPAARRCCPSTDAVGAHLAAVPPGAGQGCVGRGLPAPWTRCSCGGCTSCL
jgi:hypothetical protein